MNNEQNYFKNEFEFLLSGSDETHLENVEEI